MYTSSFFFFFFSFLLLLPPPALPLVSQTSSGSRVLFHPLSSVHSSLLIFQEIVLEALFEIFRLSVPRQDPFTQSKNKKTDQAIGTTSDTAMEQLPSRFRNVRHNALDNFIATLLYAFVNAGVIQALIDLGNEMRNESKEDTEGTSQAKSVLAFKTTVLIGELLYLSNTHLPTSQCAKLQTLPKLVNQAVSFHLDPRLRSRASTMTTYLYQYSHIKGLAQADAVMPANTGQQKWRKRKGRRLARIEEVKMKMDYKMDDQTFQQKLRETNVLVTKDYQKWRWDLIADLLRGPLTNPVHIAAAFRTKFIKRLLSFLRPSNGLFANIPQNMV
jgi:rapamycin-insensitive companion of mTOR